MKQLSIFLCILLCWGCVFSQSMNPDSEIRFYKKNMEPQGADYVDLAPVSVKDSVIIDAPIEEVWNIIDNTPDFNKWFPGTVSSQFVDPANKGLGAKRLAETKQFKYYEEIIIYEPTHEWGFTIVESNSGAFGSAVERISLVSVDDSTTKVIYRGGYAPKGMYSLLKGVIAKSIYKAWHAALLSLKEYAEI